MSVFLNEEDMVKLKLVRGDVMEFIEGELAHTFPNARMQNFKILGYVRNDCDIGGAYGGFAGYRDEKVSLCYSFEGNDENFYITLASINCTFADEIEEGDGIYGHTRFLYKETRDAMIKDLETINVITNDFMYKWFEIGDRELKAYVHPTFPTDPIDPVI